jgi:hypothetical protein
MRWAVLPLLAAACSSSGPGSPVPGGAALAYATPTSSPLSYAIADTAVVTMDIMGNPVEVNVQNRADVALSLERAADGLSGTLTFESLAGEVNSSMGAGVSLGDADKPGPTAFTVDRRGVVKVTNGPDLSGALAQVLGSSIENLVQRMFLRLPGSVVAPGTSWVDTVSITEEVAGMSTSGRSIVTSTLRGDTTVAGARLLVIDSKIDATQQVSGNNQGVEVRQNVSGTGTAVTFWDPVRGATVEQTEQSVLTGTMELPAMGMSGLPVNVRSRQSIRLRR